MNIDQLISPVPTLLPEDTGSKALDMMEENNLTELPVVSEDNYIALVHESDLLDWKDLGAALSTSEFLHYKPAIFAYNHPFEAMRIAHQMDLSVLPIVDNTNRYIGCVTKDGLLKYITENSGIDTPGGIVVLEILPRNYSLPDIARLCENEDVTIQNLQVHTNAQGMLEVTLKLNRSSLEAVVSSFERHEYHVKEVFGDNSSQDDIEGKYNLLMNYINM
jgi:CBS domain-containing protein